AAITTSSNTQAGLTYTPALNYAGPDSFTVTASDGAASDSIVISVNIINGAPVIGEGASYNLSAVKNGGARTVTFTAADPNTNPLTWSISTTAGHGTASVTGNNNTEGVISYTPATDYSGPDSFTVQVSDGALTDTITVSVAVTDPSAAPKLTIIAPHGTATPVAGNYTHPRGTALTNSVTDEIGTTTRHIVTGWTMTGDGPSTGTAKTMSMTLTRDSVLTWNFRTEHRVETSIVGSGTLSASSGWYEAGKPLQITATPAAGQYFAGWTGDIAGCQTGGKNIVIPMDRPRSTITATFAANDNFTFIALPDTQNYTSISSPADLYTRQTQWINANKNTLNIKFVTHLGDIVNSPSSQSQWQRATDAMNLMNNVMPYGTCPGNHDLASGDTNYIIRFGPNPTHASSVGRWIDPDNAQTYDWYRGASPRGYSSYQIVTVNGRDYMFLHLDMDCPDKDMAWANTVLAAHPKALTMVTTHNYLAESGGSGAYGSGTGQRGYTAQANISIGPDRNRPQEVFDVVVKPNRQVYMVICGHNFATYNLVKANNAGKNVHEVVVDWQSLPNGGNAFLRIMEYRPAQNQIYNTSYSPYLGRYVDPNNSADHQGMLDLHDRYGSEFALTTDFDTRFNTNLTVVSPHGGVSPATGTYSIEDLSPVAINATEQVVGQTRYRPIGWNLAGSQTASGTGSSATITHNGTATLTWSYTTEHYLTTSTTGAGIVSTNSGWYAADSLVNVQAQPDAGANFLQWTGDIAGCAVSGS
ncbi:MAG: Ig-like domain-containing protein, partial [Roseimicrobium sp.]